MPLTMADNHLLKLAKHKQRTNPILLNFIAALCSW